MINVKESFKFLSDRTIPINTRGRLIRKLNRLDSEKKTFDNLKFYTHPMNHLIPSLKKECLLMFINGYGVNVIEVDDDEYPYCVLRLNRKGNEPIFTDDGYHSFLPYDRRCKTKEEVTEIMLEQQKKNKSFVGRAAVICAFNYLETLHNQK